MSTLVSATIKGEVIPSHLLDAGKSRPRPGAADGLVGGAEVPLASVNGRISGVCGRMADGYRFERFSGVGPSR